MVISIFAVVMAATIAVSLIIPKSFVGETLIQLKFDTLSTGPAGATGGSTPVSIEANALVEGEAEIIRSRAVARRVFDRLDAGLRSPRLGRGAATDAELAEKPAASMEAPTTDVTLGGSDLDHSIMALQEGLSVNNDGKSYLIRVTYTANDPARAAAIANMFAEEYLQSRVESSFVAAKRTSNWLAGQVASARTLAAEADERVSEYRLQSASLLAGGGDVSAANQQLRDVVAQLSVARLDRLKLSSKLDRLRKTIAMDRVPSASDLDSSGAAQQLIDAEVKARAEVDRIASSVGVKHPLYIKATSALSDIRIRFNEALAGAVDITKADLESATQAESSLQGQLDDIKKTALSSQTAEKGMREVESDAASAHANLDRLQETYRQASALVDLKPIPAEMVSLAEPMNIPSGPKKSLFAVLGSVGGLVLGVGTILLLDLRDTGFATSSEVENEIGLTCFGMLPKLGRSPNATSQRIHLRALKLLAVRAGLLQPCSHRSVVVVTSALHGEGKTDLVRGLAATLAQAGRRTLIVEDIAFYERSRPPPQ